MPTRGAPEALPPAAPGLVAAPEGHPAPGLGGIAHRGAHPLRGEALGCRRANVLAGIAGPTRSIGACAKAYRNDWKVPLGEADYYQRVWAYTSYFMRTELLAANIVVEASHYKAALEYKTAGKPIPSQLISRRSA